MCSAAFEAFVTMPTASAPIQHGKSKKVGCWLSEPLDSLISCMTILIGGVLANQRGVWEGRNTVVASEIPFYTLHTKEIMLVYAGLVPV